MTHHIELPLAGTELETLYAAADVLIPATDSMPSLRGADPDQAWLARALQARNDAVGDLSRLLAELARAEAIETELVRWHAERRGDFDAVAGIVSGTYYLIPEVRELIGYPGQERRPAPVELAADELSDEIFEGAMAYQGSFRAAGS